MIFKNIKKYIWLIVIVLIIFGAIGYWYKDTTKIWVMPMIVFGSFIGYEVLRVKWK